MKILLISMPFGSLDRPALGISILKAVCKRRGIGCDIQYFNAMLAEQIGYETYDWVSNILPYTAFAGDWCFTTALYGDRPLTAPSYEAEILRGLWQLSRSDVARLRDIVSSVPQFLENCLQAVDWDSYDVVGFTSTFTQNIASLALARQLKRRHPRLAIVFGGANWEGQMGEELHQRFPFVDYVCQGEAEESFPSLLSHISAKTGEQDLLPGIIWRDEAGQTRSSGKAVPIEVMDSVPTPDFSDYFHRMEESQQLRGTSQTLLMEMSRGCWWGAKSHCKFCGLNGNGMRFRSKSADRVLKELDELTSTWGVHEVAVVDNILDMDYFKSVLPTLASQPQRPALFFEVKANLKRHHVELLAKSGVHAIQPGIESLSDRLLKRMGKGTTALRNLQMLKWCREYGVRPEWNILYGFPGETAADYAGLEGLLRSIAHLDPPSGCGPVRLDRFSPYFNDAAAHGIVEVRPMAPFKHLYRVPAESLLRIAYYFDFNFAPEADPQQAAAFVPSLIDAWQKSTGSRTLFADDNGWRLTVEDWWQGNLRQRVQLYDCDRAAYLLCDEVQTAETVAEQLMALFPSGGIEVERVRDLLESLTANDIMVTDGRCYLATAIYRRFPQHWRKNIPDVLSMKTKRRDCVPAEIQAGIAP